MEMGWKKPTSTSDKPGDQRNVEYFVSREVIPPPPEPSSSDEDSDDKDKVTVESEVDKKKESEEKKEPVDKTKEGEAKKENPKKKKKKPKGQKQPEYYDYFGCTFKVGYSANRKHCLTALEFKGPKTTTIRLEAEIQIQRMVEDWGWIPKPLRCIWPWGPYFKIEEFLPLARVSVYGVKKGENFKVELPYPVEIEANTFTDIKFQLLDQATGRIDKMWDRNHVRLADRSHITFEFLHGSRQLSGLYFQGVQ